MGLARFRELGIQPSEISALPAAAVESPVWRQICADVFGVPTVCLQSAEGAALGAAIQGAFAWHAANGKPATFRKLCGRIVKLDNFTCRAEPERGAQRSLRRVAHPAGRSHTPVAHGGLSVMFSL